jgi:uncharacterized protein (TIGR03435 family)
MILFVSPGCGAGVAQANTRTVDVNGPSLFTALQEQLGLKRDSQRDQAEVLLIDRV